MQLATYQSSTSAVWADALFVSVLQGSERPDAGQVRTAIAAAVRAYGGGGCAQRVAQEFGDHPETAVARMRWARADLTRIGLVRALQHRHEQGVGPDRAGAGLIHG